MTKLTSKYKRASRRVQHALERSLTRKAKKVDLHRHITLYMKMATKLAEKLRRARSRLVENTIGNPRKTGEMLSRCIERTFSVSKALREGFSIVPFDSHAKGAFSSFLAAEKEFLEEVVRFRNTWPKARPADAVLSQCANAIAVTLHTQEEATRVVPSDWDQVTERRAELIHKKNRQGLSNDEQAEYERLRQQTRASLAQAFPPPGLVTIQLSAVEQTLGLNQGVTVQ